MRHEMLTQRALFCIDSNELDSCCTSSGIDLPALRTQCSFSCANMVLLLPFQTVTCQPICPGLASLAD